MALFNVDVTFRTTLVVEAADEGDAYWEARFNAKQALNDDCNCTPEIDVRGEVRSPKDLREGWDIECIPYGGDGNTRLSALLLPGA